MSRGPRIIIAFIVTILIAAGLIKYTKAPPEAYLPPPHLYQNATSYAHGWITGFATTTYGEHLFEGSEDFHFILYKFQPKVVAGTVAPVGGEPWFTGEVRVDNLKTNAGMPGAYKVGDEVTVQYDALNPSINGVPGTVGVWSKTTGYLNHYLWWYVGFAAVVFLIQEIIRMCTKTNDLGY